MIFPYRTADVDTYLRSLNSGAYSCKRRHGALLALPFAGLEEDVIRTKVFEDYIRDHVDSWFAFARRYNFDVERMEDLILVTGCTLVTSWGVAAFVDNTSDAEVSLRTHPLPDGGAMFYWHVHRQSVNYRNSHHDAVRSLREHRRIMTNTPIRQGTTSESMRFY